MEVHHHPNVEKKGFKEYFLEFLMIFLAVTMGFVAENIRESIVDKEREHEYMQSLYQDLRTDTIVLSNAIKDKMYELVMYDSLFDILTSKQYKKETSNAYYFARRLIRFKIFYPTDGTMKQLENAGGFRLIRNREIVDSIQSYKQLTLLLKNVQDFEVQHIMAAGAQMGKIFDANIFDSMFQKNNIEVWKRPDKNYPLMPFTNTELNDYHLPMNFIKRNKLTQIGIMKSLHKKATDLMRLLKEKYHLENE